MKNKLKLVISTTDEELIKELLIDEVNQENIIELSDECCLLPLQSYQPSSNFISTPEILEFTINIVSGVSIGLLSSWIYGKLGKSKKTETEIQGIKINLNDKKSIELLIFRLISNDKNTK